jgi:WD40 repeat protein
MSKTVTLSDVATGEVKKVLPAQESLMGPITVNWVLSLAFSPNGKVLAVGYNDGSFGFWDQTTFEFSRGERQHKGSVNALAFSPDGKWLASGASGAGNEIIKIWNMDNGDLHLGVPDIKWRSDTVAFSPNSKFLAGATASDQVVLVALETKQVHRLREATPGGNDYVTSLAFSPDGKVLAGGIVSNGDIMFWDVNDKEVKKVWAGVLLHGSRGVTSLAYSPDGKLLAVCYGEGSQGLLALRDARTGAVLTTLQEKVYGGSLAFAPNGKFLVVGERHTTNSNVLTIWDLP